MHTHKHPPTHILAHLLTGCVFPGGGICPLLLKLEPVFKKKHTNHKYMTLTPTHLFLLVSLWMSMLPHRTPSSTLWTWRGTTKALALACGEEESTTWTCTCWGLLKKELLFAMGKWGYGHIIAEAPCFYTTNPRPFVLDIVWIRIKYEIAPDKLKVYKKHGILDTSPDAINSSLVILAL